jgi:tetratricopeptide (TPR) repeat protein
LAYSGLAYYYVWAADWLLSAREAMPRAREAAEKALRLDPSLAEPHVSLAIVRWWYDHDLEGARQEFQKAVALQPELPSAHMWYGPYLVAAGQTDEGLAESQRAVDLDPLSSLSSTFVGFNLYFARRNDEAIQRLRTAVFLDPDYWWAHVWLGRAYARDGRFPEAVAELRSAQRLEPFAEVEATLGRIYADAGDTAEATKVLNHLRERMRDEFVSAGYVATVLVGLGRFDEALAALAEAEVQRWYNVGWWKVDPDLDPLRSNPRFKALLKKAGVDQ